MSPKRHESLRENWLALKSQISEVAKIVAALPTFRTQENRVSMSGGSPSGQALPRPCGGEKEASTQDSKVSLL